MIRTVIIARAAFIASRSRQRSEGGAGVSGFGEAGLDEGVFALPDGEGGGEESASGIGEGKFAATAVGGVLGDLDEGAAFEGLEGGGEGGAVHGEKGCDFGDVGWCGAVERHQDGKLAVSEAERGKSAVELAGERAGGALGMEAETGIADVERGSPGDGSGF